MTSRVAPLLLVAALAASAGRDTPARAAAAGAEGALRVLATDASGVRFVWTPGAPALVTPASSRPDDGAAAAPGVLPILDDADLVTIGGVPLPARAVTIALPPEGTPQVSVALGPAATRGPIDLAPPSGDASDRAWPVTVPVSAAGLAEGAAPASVVAGAWITRLRAQRVLRLVLVPAAYVAETRTLIWTDRLDVTVHFAAGAPPAGSARAGAGVTAAGRADPFEGVYAGSLLNYEQGRAWRLTAAPAPRARLLGAGDSFASAGGNPWLKVTVRSKGVYAVGYNELRAAGLTDADVRSIDPGTVRVYTSPSGGRELATDTVPPGDDWMTQVALTVQDAGTPAQLDPGDRIAFYAWGTKGNDREWDPAALDLWYENPYTDDNVFWITWGGMWSEPPRRVIGTPSDPTPGLQAETSFTSRLHVESNNFYDPSLKTYSPSYGKFGQRWERWWGERLQAGYPAVFSIAQLPGAVIAPDAGVRLRARLWGVPQAVSPRCVPHHVVDLRVNGQSVGLARWYYANVFDVDTTGYWAAARESLSFKSLARYDSSGACVGNLAQPVADIVYLAWYELDYPRRFEAVSDWLEFTAPAGPGQVRRFALSGFTPGAHVHVYDVTYQTAPREILPTTAVAGEEGASIVVQDTLGVWARRYVATTEERFTSPAPARAQLASPLLRDAAFHAADYVVIAHPSFLGTARALAAHRYGNVPDVPGADTVVVPVTDVYDQFGWGVVDPAAIRNFVAFAYGAWARRPSYVALIGDASWDYKNYLRAADGSKSFIPGFVGSGSPYSQNVLTDTWYVEVDPGGPDAADLYVGRLPVRTDAEGLAIVNQKLVPYEEQPVYDTWRARALIVADDTTAGCGVVNGTLVPTRDAIGWAHTGQAEDLVANLPPEIDRQKLYTVLYPYARGQCVKRTAHDELIGQLDAGALAINYIGHGWWDVLGHEQFLRISDVPSLANGQRLTVLIAASCAVGKFDEPAAEGISETLVKMPVGGGIATFSATDLAYSYSNSVLNIRLVEELFPQKDVTSVRTFGRAAVRAILASANADQYAVIGDPALRIAVPAHDASLVLTGGTLTQGGTAEVTGSVLDDQGMVDAGFSGTADVEVRGSERYVDGAKDDWLSGPGREDDFFLPGPVIYRGRVPVSAGRYSAQFVVPADSAVLGARGRVRVYVAPATAAPHMDALGALDSVSVVPGALAPDDSLDVLALDFPGGSLVVPGNAELTIRVRDRHGVNLTDLPGSQINLVLDGLTYDLTDRFTYDTGSYTSGTALFALPGLRIGPHTVQVAASDAYGNRAVFPPTLAPLKFDVAEGGQLALRQVLSMPDRPSQGAWIIATLDSRTTATRLRGSVKVYSLSGRLIRTLDVDQTPAGPSGSRQIQILWDGRDAGGDRVATGVYFYKVRAEDPASGARAEATGRGTIVLR